MASITKYTKKDGSTAYKFQTYLGIDPLTGKPKKTTRSGFKTKKEADLALSRLMLDVDKNGLSKTDNDNITFKEVYELWVDQYRHTVKENTLRMTKYYFNDYILPSLGKYRINNITVAQVQKAVNKWAGQVGMYKLMNSYVSMVYRFANNSGISNIDPAKKVIMPKKKKKVKAQYEQEDGFYTREELRTFMDCASKVKDLKKVVFFRLAAFTGARKSEILALNWTDIDFTRKQLHINKTLAVGLKKVIVNTPKTEASIRSISLDDETLALLKRWRKDQLEKYLKLGINTNKPNQPIFTTYHNTHIRPSAVFYWLRDVLQKNDLKKITVHGFRHTHASLLFEAGASLQEVKERLGHANIKTTMDIYTHVTEKTKEETADKFLKFMEN